MNKILLFLSVIFLPLGASAQFGFERIDTITVIDGTTQELPWAGGLDYAQFSNIDLNFDGTPDLFVFDRTCNKVLTFLHTGTPNVAEYVYAPEYETVFPAMFDWAFLVDYNCDGLEDIFTYNIGTIKIFKNIGSVGTGHQFELVKAQLKGVHPWYVPPQFVPVSSIDIPCFVDVDGDSDIDILNFDVSGFSVEYHKNLSIENYGVCDSLDFELKNLCWGQFRENGSSNAIDLNSTDGNCGSNIANPEYEGGHRSSGPRHAGGTSLALDMDGNGVMDFVVGDISYSNMVLLMNGGTAPNQDSPMTSVDYAFPSNTIPVDIDLDPAAFHVDVNNDGIRDLLVSPALKVGSENKESVWYYENTNLDNTPVFSHVENDFLQGDMIDQGSSTLPVFFDHNADGLMDLLVSAHGQYDPLVGGNNLVSKIAYYENTGTASSPEFTLITDDYQNLSTQGLGSSRVFYPTFGDLDNDGDEDMILGEWEGYCYYSQNTGGAGNPAIFNTFILLEEYFDGSGTYAPIFEGTFPFPQLVDLDRDDDLDLVMGKKNGTLTYYENTGNSASYKFEQQTTELGMVDVKEFWNPAEGYSIPQFIEVDNEYELVLGSSSGYLHYYDNIEGNLSGSWNQVDTTLEDIYIGTYSAPAIYDLTSDNRLEMVLGNKRGGLGLYKSAPISNIGIEENAFGELKVYPNPASTEITIDFGAMSYDELQNTSITIFDLMGRNLLSTPALNGKMSLNLAAFTAGTYIVQLSNGASSLNKKLIIQ